MKNYKSISTGQACSAAQYAAELVCIRKREKENCGSLEFKFWNKSQKKEYEIQIRVASKIIKKYSELALVKYLNSKSGFNIYALGFLHKSKKFVLILDFVEAGVAKCFDNIEKQKEKPKNIIRASEEDYKPKKPRKSKSIFSKIRKIDGKN